MQNGRYESGYRVTAHKIKKRRVWTNWAIGTVILTAIIGIAASNI
jgi:hypothetical protein